MKLIVQVLAQHALIGQLFHAALGRQQRIILNAFKLVESDRQEIKNPALKQKVDQIKRIKKELKKLYKKLSKAKEVLNKDGVFCLLRL